MPIHEEGKDSHITLLHVCVLRYLCSACRVLSTVLSAGTKDETPISS